ncbi:MAG: hypothetical protein K2X48_00075 [Chitinophagaceae bacterium]|nr:hypothetical protein [Chitinophagaceae bacterium]
MDEITIQVKNKKKLPFLKELLAQMDFVEVVAEKKEARKKEILADLKESVDFVNAYKKGKTKTKSLKQLLHEL